jgi:hypothetical protein
LDDLINETFMGRYREVKHIDELEPGNIIKSKSAGTIYVVVANYGGRATAVKIADVTNAPEWEVYKEDEQ